MDSKRVLTGSKKQESREILHQSFSNWDDLQISMFLCRISELYLNGGVQENRMVQSSSIGAIRSFNTKITFQMCMRVNWTDLDCLVAKCSVLLQCCCIRLRDIVCTLVAG